MDSDKELELCYVVCGIYYTCSKRKAVGYTEETFIENCLYSDVSGMSFKCNCLTFEQYACIRQNLPKLDFVYDAIPLPETTDIEEFKTCLLCSCGEIFGCCDVKNEIKADFVPVVEQKYDTIDAQVERLSVVADVDEPKIYGLVCLLYAYVYVMQRAQSIKACEEAFTVLKGMFFGDTTKKLTTCVANICIKPQYYEFFAHNNSIVSAGVQDGYSEHLMHEILQCIKCAVEYMRKSTSKYRTTYAWIKAIWSLRDDT